MSCCGEGRAQLRAAHSKPRSGPGASFQSPVIFESVSATPFTVLAPVTGHSYQFAKAGARAAVDARDERHLLSIRSLRRIQAW